MAREAKSKRVISFFVVLYGTSPRSGSSLAFDLEEALRPPVASWLRGTGLDVHEEIAILGRRADLVGVGPDRVVAVELKLSDWRRALRQAVAYQVAVDEAWVAMPLPAAARAYREAWRFRDEGVGLLAVDDRGGVRTPIPTAPSPRLLPFAREALASAARGLLFSKEETVLEAF